MEPEWNFFFLTNNLRGFDGNYKLYHMNVVKHLTTFYSTSGGRLQPGVTTALKEHMLTLSLNSFILRFHPSVASFATEG